MIPAWSMWALVAVTGLACLTLMVLVADEIRRGVRDWWRFVHRPAPRPLIVTRRRVVLTPSARAEMERTWLTDEITWNFPAREIPEVHADAEVIELPTEWRPEPVEVAA